MARLCVADNLVDVTSAANWGARVDRSFEEIYFSSFDDLVRLAAMIGGAGVPAEDVVQDAFASLYLRFDRIQNPMAYLRRSVVNGCVSRFRRHRREHLVSEPTEQVEAGLVDAVDRLDLEARLLALPARQRAAVVLRIQVGLSEAETAEVLGCRPGTVGSLVHRALRALRVDLEEAKDAVD